MGKRKSNKVKEVLEDFVLQGIKVAAEKEINRIAEEVSNEEMQECRNDPIAPQNSLENNAGIQGKKEGTWRIGYNERANMFGLKTKSPSS